MFLLVCFDISDDKDRYLASKVLKGVGSRVQKSVFECSEITERQFLKLKDQLESIIDQRTDSVRYYPLCKKCVGDVEWSGLGEEPDTDSFKVV